MKSTLLITLVSLLKPLPAGQRINVAVCNLDGINKSLVSRAKEEAELIYRSMQVQIVWRSCTPTFAFLSPAQSALFLIRLRNDKPPAAAGPASLDVMGKAFVNSPEGGYLADAYLQAIRATSEERHTDAGILLGFVVAHELGHLLLGPGHARDGVMQAVWGESEVEALAQRRLRFNRESAERIQHALEARTGVSDDAPPAEVRPRPLP
jgi:hypothetical protein